MTATTHAPQTEQTEGAVGRLARIIGPVVDVEFPPGQMPALYNLLKTEVEVGGETKTINLEVAQDIGDNMVRAISMDTTEGLTRGQLVTDTGSSIQAPVGPGTLGRIMNVTGDPIDERGEIKCNKRNPIHVEPPAYIDQSTSAEILVTGIKVVDLLAPYARGGKIGLFGGAGVGKTVFIQELIVSGDLGTATRSKLTCPPEQRRQVSRWFLSVHRCR